ncbi:M10 family metallopeptidase C-terminal domain-containing protein [Pseudomonas massiliensis]|uniref:M10 family metallopeptidase C-terminal domain-containing protein n=1 Tax=Pseudomonas massiliensis TaxID=522492 RepID=UPI00058DA8C2|nr:glycosyl hydrolase family 28-related protein [Pseudomonas massiliensis]
MTTTFNVMDYGAKGDGATDDTRAIQLAINAAAKAGGGEVRIPPGTFIVSGPNADGACLTLKNNVHLVGFGQAETVLKLIDGSSANIDGIVRASARYNTSNASVENLTVDGNQAHTSATVHGVVTGSATGAPAHAIDFAVSAVAMVNCSGNGLLANALSVRLSVSDSLAADNGGDGFSTCFETESNGIKGDRIKFMDNEAARNGGDGVDVLYGNYSEFANVRSHDNGGNGMVMESLATDVEFKGDAVLSYADLANNGGAGAVVRGFTPYMVSVSAHDNDSAGFRFQGNNDVLLMQSEARNNQQAAAPGIAAAEIEISGYVDADGHLLGPADRLDIENSSIVSGGKSNVGIALEPHDGQRPHIFSGTLFGGLATAATGLGDALFNIDAINRIYGSADADVLDTPLGAVALFGEGGSDRLVGGVYADRLQGGAGSDRLVGGGGADVFVFTQASDSYQDSATTFDTVDDFQVGSDKLDLTGLGLQGLGNGLDGTVALSYDSAEDLTLLRSLTETGPSQGFELALLGDLRGKLSSADFVTLRQGTAGADTLDESAAGGATVIRGNAGNDMLTGSAEDNYLVGGAGADTLNGGLAGDVFVYERITDSFVNDRTGVSSVDVIRDFAPYPYGRRSDVDRIDLSALGFSGLGDGHDSTLLVSERAGGGLVLESLDADADGNRFRLLLDNQTDFARYGNNITEGMFFRPGPILPVPASPVHGGQGDDWLADFDARTVLTGAGGDDWIYAGGGDDVLDGGLGKDELTGGTGVDRFRFSSTADSIRGQNDVIVDFLASRDVLDLSVLGYTGLGNGTDGTVKVVYNNELDRTYIKNFDVNASGERFEITLLGNLQGQLGADDFMFAQG